MVHLLAAIATDAEHMPSLLYSLRGVAVPPPEHPDGETWGVGYYADGHALTIRKPGELVGVRNLYELAGAVKSRVLMTVIQRGSAKAPSAAPYRFRRWLFGAIGDLSALAAARGRIMDAIPDFITSELGGAGAGGLAFAMYLRELHQRNLLSDPMSDGPAVAEALKRAVGAMDMLAAEAGAGATAACFAATNGRTLVVARGRGGPKVHWRRQEGLEAMPEGVAAGDPQLVADALKRFRAVVFGADLAGSPSGWTEMSDGATLWVDRQLSVNEVHG
ncbi:MAG: hypothetical protein IT384_31255 [Deltaproteobacteria bacterium]|nr:hypothetical protein [Deltaproteobacteria bacterium]